MNVPSQSDENRESAISEIFAYVRRGKFLAGGLLLGTIIQVLIIIMSRVLFKASLVGGTIIGFSTLSNILWLYLWLQNARSLKRERNNLFNRIEGRRPTPAALPDTMSAQQPYSAFAAWIADSEAENATKLLDSPWVDPSLFTFALLVWAQSGGVALLAWCALSFTL